MGEMSVLEQESMRVILLDTRNRVLSTQTVYQGSLNTTMVRIAELFREAIRGNCAAIIVAHNHPSGDPSPSPEDVAITKEIVAAGKSNKSIGRNVSPTSEFLSISTINS